MDWIRTSRVEESFLMPPRFLFWGEMEEKEVPLKVLNLLEDRKRATDQKLTALTLLHLRELQRLLKIWKSPSLPRKLYP